MNARYPAVALRARHRCEYCSAPESMFNFPFEVEHIRPLSQGGEDHETNWALACRSCNVYKGAHLTYPDPETSEVVSLYHPRLDVWETHFQIETETGRLLGKTGVGRATIACLHMNSDAQLLARQQWLRLGMFP
ncbi:MAG: HNH endonuclease [Chloroflexi bacterium]|nr:MAG: HNH endonuclease [Chloroflexota bacterium]